MFSFFGKNDKSNLSAVRIDNRVGAELKAETGLPAAKPVPAAAAQCRPARIVGKPPQVGFEADNGADPAEKAFLVTGLPGDRNLAFINHPEANRFEVWWMGSGNTLVQAIETGSIHPDQGKWLNYLVLDAACLPDNRLLLAIGYYNPRPAHALVVFDPASAAYSHLRNIEANAQNREKYFEYRPLSAASGLALFYTDMKRESAEIYHNYQNHFLLFSPDFVDGLEVLNIGIDVGNVKHWQVIDKVLFMETFDSRGHQEPRRGFWSLDLSKLIR